MFDRYSQGDESLGLLKKSALRWHDERRTMVNMQIPFLAPATTSISPQRISSGGTRKHGGRPRKSRVEKRRGGGRGTKIVDNWQGRYDLHSRTKKSD